jgi:hypothetical protein
METIFDWGMNIKKFKKKKDKSVSAAVLKAGDKYPLIKCGKYWTIDMNGMIHKPEDLDSIEPKRT